MFDSASHSDPAERRKDSGVPGFVRGRSEVRATFESNGSTTGIAQLYESGSLRLRMLRAHGSCEAALLNTGGGIAGGDRLKTSIAVGQSARVTMTSQAAEKIYRAEREPAELAVRLKVGHDARLDWLPQETILHDGAQMMRTMNVDMEADATLNLLEIVVFGRLARGERLQSGGVRDRWRVRRGGRLILAEQVALDGAIADRLDCAAIGSGARAVATFVHVGPSAEERIESVRAAMARTDCLNGASAWNGILVARMAAPSPVAVRMAAEHLIMAVVGEAPPRSWSC